MNKRFLDLSALVETTNLRASDRKVAKAAVEERFDFSYGDAHGLSYLLGPHYAGEEIDAETRSSVELFLTRWCGNQN